MLLNKNIIYITLVACIFTHSQNIQSHIKTILNEDELVCLIDQKHPTIIMGSMEACPHCKTITPLFEDQAKKHTSINFVKSNGPKINMHGVVKRESQGKGDFKIIGYPAFVFIKDKQIVNVVLGGTPETLEKAIAEFEKEVSPSSKKSKKIKKNT